MRNKIAVVAASVALMLSAAGTFGGEVEFQTPTTDRAQQVQPLLLRAARAIHDKTSSTHGDRISNLWIFPTGDEHTVFVQYTVSTKNVSSKGDGSQIHLELVRMQGNRIVEERDLTGSANNGTLSARKNANTHNVRSSS